MRGHRIGCLCLYLVLFGALWAWAATATAQLPPASGTLPVPGGVPIPGPGIDPVALPSQIPPPELPLESSEAWYSPMNWFGPEMWEGSVEVGLNAASGNTESVSLRTGAKLTRETDSTKGLVELTYARNEANGVETQHFAQGEARGDFKFAESPWTLFQISRLLYDEFRPFDVRLSFSAGLGYRFWDSENLKLTGRFGPAVSHEVGGVDDSWVPEALFGVDWEQKLTERQKITMTTDYFPAWEDFNDYRIVSNVAWEVLLDEASNLSLKLAAIDNYDSTPSGARPNDINYSLLLLWKL